MLCWPGVNASKCLLSPYCHHVSITWEGFMLFASAGHERDHGHIICVSQVLTLSTAIYSVSTKKVLLPGCGHTVMLSLNSRLVSWSSSWHVWPGQCHAGAAWHGARVRENGDMAHGQSSQILFITMTNIGLGTNGRRDQTDITSFPFSPAGSTQG